MKDHTITVSFDTDEVGLASIIASLNGAGYTVPGHELVN